MMRAVAIIPARFAATRFPGKPLAPIAGVPLVQRVWMGTREAKSVERVVIDMPLGVDPVRPIR